MHRQFDPRLALRVPHHTASRRRPGGCRKAAALLEAFAAQYLGCEKELGLNREITNINGSGIGLGHPVGATGARLIVTLIHALKQKNKSRGLATLCGGGGVSMACAIEMV
jgi:acetyl-CoA C-acetyltransferase